MIRTAVIGLAGLALIVAGCNGDPPSATTTAADGSKGSAAATKAPAFTDSQLATALLTTTDLGGTWKVAPKSTATPKTSPSPAAAATPQSDTGCAYLDRLIKNSDKGGADDFGGGAGPEVNFTVDTFGPFLFQKVSASGEADAKKLISLLSGLASNCKTFQSVDENGTATEFRVERIDLKKAGDDTVGLRLTGATPPTLLGSLTVEFSMITVRRGQLLSTLAWIGINTKPDPAFLQKLTDTSAEKLNTVKR